MCLWLDIYKTNHVPQYFRASVKLDLTGHSQQKVDLLKSSMDNQHLDKYLALKIARGIGEMIFIAHLALFSKLYLKDKQKSNH